MQSVRGRDKIFYNNFISIVYYYSDIRKVYITWPVNVLMKTLPDDGLLEIETRIILLINFEVFYDLYSVDY
jgi:hypothetical protein